MPSNGMALAGRLRPTRPRSHLSALAFVALLIVKYHEPAAGAIEADEISRETESEADDEDHP